MFIFTVSSILPFVTNFIYFFLHCTKFLLFKIAFFEICIGNSKNYIFSFYKELDLSCLFVLKFRQPLWMKCLLPNLYAMHRFQKNPLIIFALPKKGERTYEKIDS